MTSLDPETSQLSQPKASLFRKHVATAAFLRAQHLGVRRPKPYRSFNINAEDLVANYEDFYITEATNVLLGNPAIAALFDARYIRDLIRITLGSAFSGDSEADSLDAVMNDLLVQDATWRIIVPVSGIGRMAAPLTLGGVTVLRPNDAYMAELHQQLLTIWQGQAERSPEQTERQEAFQRRLLDEYRSECLAEVVEDGTKDRVTEKGLERIRYALAILNYFGVMYFATYENLRLGLKGDFLPDRANRKVLLISIGNQPLHSSQQETLAGPHYGLEIAQHFWEHANEGGYPRLHQWKEGSLNEYQSAIERAIRWFINGIKQDNRESRFIHSIIALEMLLCRGLASITEEISSYVGVLLGQDDRSRQGIKRIIKDHYDVRSDIVHKGRTDILVDTVIDLEHWVKVVIKRLLTADFQFNSLRDFGAYLFAESMNAGLITVEAEVSRSREHSKTSP